MKKIILAAALLVFGYTGASAQYYGQGHDRAGRGHQDYGNSVVNDMQRDARRQIQMGINRGLINPREASILTNEYDRIEAKQRRFSHRGRLSPREERILINDLERLMSDTRHMSNRRPGDNWARSPRGRY